VVRERAELIAERVSIVNRIGAILATLGTGDYSPLLQTRRRCLDGLRTASDQPLPNHARAKIIHLLTRLELVLARTAEIDQRSDAVLN
jgi:transposase